MKKKKWDNPNKMHFESLHKTFNKQCTCISKGNQIGRVVLSSYVRPFNEIECNGHISEKGHLQEYDLKWLLKGLSSYAKDYIRSIAIDKSVIAYHFFYYRGDKKIDIGFVVTDVNNNHLKTFYTPYLTEKSRSALNEARKYIMN